MFEPRLRVLGGEPLRDAATRTPLPTLKGAHPMTKIEKRAQRLELALSELAHAADGFLSLVDIAQKESGKPRSHAFSELLAASRELIANSRGTLAEEV